MHSIQTIIVSQLVLGLAILVHELGHLFAMRAVGVKAETFSVGFGKGWKLFTWKGTEFMVTPFILGGYVEADADSYEKAKAHEKLMISLAGPLAGLVGAIIPFFIVQYFYEGAELLPAIIFSVKIPFVLFFELNAKLYNGIYHFFVHVSDVATHVTVNHAGRASSNYTFMEDADGKKFSLYLAVISVAVSILNMVPLPPFDGGHAVSHVYEIISGRKVNRKFFQWTTLIVASLFIIVFLISIYNDIRALF